MTPNLEPEKCAIVTLLFWLFAIAAVGFCVWLVIGGVQ